MVSADDSKRISRDQREVMLEGTEKGMRNLIEDNGGAQKQGIYMLENCNLIPANHMPP